MRIALTSIPYINREKFFIDLKDTWPNYKIHDLGFSQMFSSKLTKEKLDEELNKIIEIYSKYNNALSDNVIFSISPIDFLVKVMFAIDDQWIDKTLFLYFVEKIKPLFNNVDVIFYLPISKFNDIKIPDQIQMDEFCDAKFLADLDNNIKDIIALFNIRLKNPFFNVEDCPAVIEIFGTDEQKIQNVKMYLDKDGVLREPNNILNQEQNKLLEVLSKDLKLQEKELEDNNKNKKVN